MLETIRLFRNTATVGRVVPFILTPTDPALKRHDIADTKAQSVRGPVPPSGSDRAYAPSSHPPPSDRITNQAIIDRLQAVERVIAIGFIGRTPDRPSSWTSASEQTLIPPSYESPPPSWRS